MALKVTQQAIIISIIGALAAIFIAFKGFALPGLIVMAGAFLAAYNSNCAVVGHCDLWAWTLVIVYGVNMFLVSRLISANKIKMM
jgi:hypothetical protein